MNTKWNTDTFKVVFCTVQSLAVSNCLLWTVPGNKSRASSIIFLNYITLHTVEYLMNTTCTSMLKFFYCFESVTAFMMIVRWYSALLPMQRRDLAFVIYAMVALFHLLGGIMPVALLVSHSFGVYTIACFTASPLAVWATTIVYFMLWPLWVRHVNGNFIFYL